MEDDATFVRQRRNLFLATFALLVAMWTGATLNHFKILDVDFSFKETISVEFILWFVWGYFLLRYWQVFSIDPLWKAVSEEQKDVVGQLTLKNAKAQMSKELFDPKVPWRLVRDTLQYRKYHEGIFARLTLEFGSASDNKHDAFYEHVFADDELIKIYILTWRNIIFHRLFFSELILPFGIALAPLGYAIVRH